MAACYSSSASAPLHALANQLLGESTASAKTSLFCTSNHPSHQQQQQHHPQQHQSAGLFPRQHPPNYPPRQTLHHEKQSDPFDQAWSASVGTPPTGEHWSPQFMQPRPLFQRHLPDLDLISSWEHAVQETTPFKPQQHVPLENQHRTAPSTIGGMAISAGPEEFSMAEYEAFQYAPPQAAVAQVDIAGKDSAWAQEMVRGQLEEDDEDDEDEFREEWSNDHFTQAYINSHQQQFRKIEEQEDLKEARLAEERERQRVVSGGPPRSAWMMAGSTVSAPNTSMAPTPMPTTSEQYRLRIPGLQEPFSLDLQEQISVDEFLQFRHDEGPNGPSSMQPMLEPQHQQQVKPIKAEDRFLSLVSDLRLAEQIYYPGASSATLTDQGLPPSEQHSHVAKIPSAGGGTWAQEFTHDHRYEQSQQQQRHLGAEWNWEKLFGKDPRKALQLATEASKASAAMVGGPSSEMTEHDRLKTVALARLQALFGHLSLTSPHAAPSPP